MRSLVLLAALILPLASAHAQSGGTAPQREPVYFDFQVEVQAQLKPGTANPKYPEALKTAKVEGQVLAQFVVDTEGLIDTTSFKILKASHPEFSQAVRDAVPDMRFVAALVGNRKVRQLVQLPFVFNTR